MIDREHFSAGLGQRLSSETPRPPEGDSFLKGPIPLSWLAAAARLPGRSLHVGLAIWCAAGRQRTHQVTLPNIDAGTFGLSRNTKYRALQWLEGAGLISVERKIGRAPIVTVLEEGGARARTP
jgi:hypothetical protein